MNSLQASLFNDEDLTVLAGDTFEDENTQHVVIPQDDHDHVPSSFSEDSDLLKQPNGLVRQPTPPFEGLSCSVGSVLQAMSATLGGDEDSLPPMPQMASSYPPNSDQGLQKRTHTQARMSPPRSRELSAEAEAWRERYYQQPLRTVRTARPNFRTGLSGHQGLVSYMVHPHSYLGGQQQTQQNQQRQSSSLPKMSSHSGLSRTHRSSQSARLSPPSFTYSSSRDQTPSFTFSSSRDQS